jgi:hypothetical protein
VGGKIVRRQKIVEKRQNSAAGLLKAGIYAKLILDGFLEIRVQRIRH